MRPVLALLLLLTSTPARADALPCGASELAQAQEAMTRGANLLASPDPVISMFGLEVMDAAARRRDAVAAMCFVEKDDRKRWSDKELEKLWGPARFMTKTELQAAAVIFSVEATPEAIGKAMLQAGMEELPASMSGDPFDWYEKGER